MPEIYPFIPKLLQEAFSVKEEKELTRARLQIARIAAPAGDIPPEDQSPRNLRLKMLRQMPHFNSDLDFELYLLARKNEIPYSRIENLFFNFVQNHLLIQGELRKMLKQGGYPDEQKSALVRLIYFLETFPAPTSLAIFIQILILQMSGAHLDPRVQKQATLHLARRITDFPVDELCQERFSMLHQLGFERTITRYPTVLAEKQGEAYAEQFPSVFQAPAHQAAYTIETVTQVLYLAPTPFFWLSLNPGFELDEHSWQDSQKDISTFISNMAGLLNEDIISAELQQKQLQAITTPMSGDVSQDLLDHRRQMIRESAARTRCIIDAINNDPTLDNMKIGIKCLRGLRDLVKKLYRL